MHEITLVLIEVGALLLIMSLASRFANRLGQSPIPFYMTIGLLFGVGGFLSLEASMPFLKTGSEIGVVLLLLMLGLEFSPRELVGTLKSSASVGVWDALLNAVPGAAFGLIMGWGPLGALVMAGVTWVSSSGVISKVLTDLGRVGNRETPTVLAVLVIEDLAMAFYLPILSAFVIGASIVQGAITVAVAVGSVFVVLLVALRFGKRISRFFSSTHIESLVIGVLGLAMLVAGLAAMVQVSSAVGAFLVGIAISGEVAKMAQKYLRPVRDLFAAFFFLVFGLTTDSTAIPGALLPAAILAVVTIGTKILTGYLGARRAGIGRAGRWRAGFALTPRGEFSIIIAGLAVAAGLEPAIAPIAATYMLITVVVGPLLSRVSDTQAFKKRFRSSITQPVSLPPAR
jgi:CPA2 family monovalent cation:H+ antiporter-2